MMRSKMLGSTVIYYKKFLKQEVAGTYSCLSKLSVLASHNLRLKVVLVSWCYWRFRRRRAVPAS
jgi:hypothetical protein